MRIVVVGEGKVGSTIVKQLSMEGHDVVIIDNDPIILKMQVTQWTFFV